MLAIVVVVTFFVTSSDSGSLVIDIITAGGNPDPPVIQRLFWAILEGVVAAVLLLGGGLVALQTAAITTGLPFSLVLLGMCFALHRGLADYKEGQTFEIFTEDVNAVERRTRTSEKLPTYGRRRFW
jgi:choline/glycine/proline betaine transport protein